MKSWEGLSRRLFRIAVPRLPVVVNIIHINQNQLGLHTAAEDAQGVGVGHFLFLFLSLQCWKYILLLIVIVSLNLNSSPHSILITGNSPDCRGPAPTPQIDPRMHRWR